MFQLVRNARKITIITKEPGKSAELIELLLFAKADLDQTHVFALQLIGDVIKVYQLTAPTVDHTPAAPIEHPRNLGVGVVVTENKYPAPIDPKEWSRQYHVELDRSVVRQTEDAVILEHNLEGVTPETPLNFPIEPTIREQDIQYHKVGSGALTITLLRNEMMYRVKQEQVRSDGAQDNHDFYIPAIIAVKDLPTEPSDVPALKLRYDEGSQLPTEISLNEPIKRTILDAITDIDLEFSTDLTDEHHEQLKLKLTFKQLNPDNTEVIPRRSKEAQIHLPSLIIQWGEIAGTLANQTDLKTALDGKANILVGFTKPDGSVIDLDIADIPSLMEEIMNLHNTDTSAHQAILDEIAGLQQQSDENLQAIRDEIDLDIESHNADTSAHTPLRRDLQHEFEIHLAAHNTAANSHQNIQTAWNRRLEEHNQDPLEDQHPLIRAQINALAAAALPDARTLPDGDYKIRVAGGVVSLELL
jgi:hypothetical protein